METENKSTETSESKAEVASYGKIPRLALYCRVSTDDQTNENQKLKLLAYATSKNMPFDLFLETESSGRHRPVKEQLLNNLRNGKYSELVIYRLDRWGRSTTELLLEMNELVSKGIGFVSLSEKLDMSSASGRMHVEILAVFSSFEKNLLKERTIIGLQRARASGKILGRQHGQKDTKPRKKSGYYLRYARKRQLEHQKKTGEYRAIEEFITQK